MIMNSLVLRLLNENYTRELSKEIYFLESSICSLNSSKIQLEINWLLTVVLFLRTLVQTTYVILCSLYRLVN